LNPLTINAPVSVTVRIKNTGKTVALKLVALCTIHPSAEKIDIAEFARGVAETSDGKPISTTCLFPNAIHSVVPATQNRVSQIQIREVESGKELIYVFGTITYEDIFRTSHTTHFGNLYDPAIKMFLNCATYNDAD
jgi:hypothetical protein